MPVFSVFFVFHYIYEKQIMLIIINCIRACCIIREHLKETKFKINKKLHIVKLNTTEIKAA